MQINVNDEFKFASVWLTKDEIDDASIMEELQPVIREFRAKKYKFVFFESGKGNLLELTKDLLKHNKNLVVNSF